MNWNNLEPFSRSILLNLLLKNPLLPQGSALLSTTKKYSKTVATTIIPANTQKVTAAPNCSFIDGNVLVTRNTKNQFSITANPEAMAFVSVVNNSPIIIQGMGPRLKKNFNN
ncbi:GSCOCG00001410001-RA-CDS [Cotesia congregata]|nr:GSCOCG00001410001-RA-CDS [Cotesia congregata]